jgi:hypothetical protein
MESDQNPANDWPPEVIEKVKKDLAAREAVKKRYPNLFASVSRAMFRHDPIDINFVSNRDEYDDVAGTVLPRLNQCASVDDVAKVLHEEFIKSFHSDVAGDRARYMLLANEVWKLWNEAKT